MCRVQVSDGMAVLKRMNVVETDQSDRPVQEVKIRTARVAM